MSFNKTPILWLLVTLLLAFGAYHFGKNQTNDQNASKGIFLNKNSSTSKPTFIESEWQDVHVSRQEKSSSATKLSNNKLGLDSTSQLPKKSDSTKTQNLPQKEKISQFIADAKPEEIDFYLKQYFSDDVLVDITDKREFSDRLLQAYSDIDVIESKTPHGEVFFSEKAHFPEQIINNFNLAYRQKMYAHLGFDGSVANTGAVFIRWVRLVDNKVLLFERKPIDSQSDKNWVSLKPTSDWQTGAYLVTYYLFNSKLSIIAQNTYNIDTVGN